MEGEQLRGGEQTPIATDPNPNDSCVKAEEEEDRLRGLNEYSQTNNLVHTEANHIQGFPDKNLIHNEANSSLDMFVISHEQIGTKNVEPLKEQKVVKNIESSKEKIFNSNVEGHQTPIIDQSEDANNSAIQEHLPSPVNQIKNIGESTEVNNCVQSKQCKEISAENGTCENLEHDLKEEMIFECEDEDQNQQKTETTVDIRQLSPPNLRSQSLDDFIDVVTTYKCKFCLFSCGWKSGLKSHIRNCHLGSKSSATPVRIPTNSKSGRNVLKRNMKGKGASLKSKTSVPSGKQKMQGKKSANDQETAERHIFLCGECSTGFDTFDRCRKHMFQAHKFNVQEGITQSCEVSSTKNVKEPKEVSTEKENTEDEDGDDYEYEAELQEDDGDGIFFGRKEEIKHVKTKPGKARVRKGFFCGVKEAKELQDEFVFSNKKKRISKGRISEKPYRCNEAGCGCGFMSETNLEYHRQCHVGEENPFTCPECSQGFDQWRCLLLHLWKEHLIDLDLLTCAECGYKTYSQFKMDTHQKIHSDVRDYMCSTCGKCFKQLSQLRNHSIMHMDRSQVASNGQKRWYNTQKCETCGRSFSDSKCLRKHQQAVHSKIKPYICNFCGHTSARKAMLQLHMRQHTGEKPFTCEFCDYKTGDHNSLRRHRMRHTGSKPYKCTHCPYSCIQAISLKTHLKNKHPGSEGLFACNLCNFRSVSKENLVHHLSDHKRGIVPTTASTVQEKSVTVGIRETSDLNLHPAGSVQQQTPGNMVSAQLICSCLNVLTEDGETVDLPPGCITVGENGTQTITIQIPTSADQETGEQYYFTIQQDVMPGSAEELGLLENTGLKLADEEVTNVTDFMVNESMPNISELPNSESCE